jgi:pimeloyl-ACP methyl ester carboxylesterase
MNGSTPTVMLLHGAFTDASSWAGVVAELQGSGIPVLAPAVPLRGLVEDAACIRGLVAQVDGPVLLVGHAYGGAVATVVGGQARNIVGLVYVAGFALEEGESVVSTLASFPQTLFAAALKPVEARNGNGQPAVDLYLKNNAFRAVFADDLDAVAAAVMAAGQRPIAAAALEEKAAAAGWRTLPCWYVVATADQIVHPDAQRFMARRAGAETTELDGSHAIPISQPAAIAVQIRNATKGAVTCH